MSLERLLDAESESLSLTDVKSHLRLLGIDSDDDSIRDDIAAARKYTENYLRKTLVTSTWVLKLDCFESEIELTMPPIQSVSSVVYIDTDGASQTLDSSLYTLYSGGRLMASFGNSWPGTRSEYDAVTITYIAGDTHAGNVEQDIKHAMKMLIGDYQNNKEDSVFGVSNTLVANNAKDILNMHRIWKL